MFYFIFKFNPAEGIALIIIILIFYLIRFFIFRKKPFQRYNENSSLQIPLGYAFGGIFVLMALMTSFGIFRDLFQGAPFQLGGILVLTGLWIFGFLLIYYSYKAKIESNIPVEKSVNKKKTLKDKKEEAKLRKYWFYYLSAFFIVVFVLRYIFRSARFTLGSLIGGIVGIGILYFYFKFSSKQSNLNEKNKKPINPKKIKYELLLIILIVLLVFSLIFTFVILISSSKNDSGRCISKDLYPVNGIPGLQYCEEDSDCIRVTDRFSCCDSCHGGESNSINKKHVEFWECLRLQNTKTECSNSLCNYNVTSQACFANAICVNNICSLDY